MPVSLFGFFSVGYTVDAGLQCDHVVTRSQVSVIFVGTDSQVTAFSLPQIPFLQSKYGDNHSWFHSGSQKEIRIHITEMLICYLILLR
ncbi:hypothetical protein GDO78_021752 [Eleutherodactylus coqui]|uniref:Uncharacterized protein n=1 Tax=Eleutherodactylus coqui TaxID=57060 RepID=A0A8J6EH56_ELECQ|nr:hypothetical protein GDO78_021752 [Eleutherodactylus coqui]